MKNLDQALISRRAIIETALLAALKNDDQVADEMYDIIRYHLGVTENGQALSGKLIRPLFTLLCCEAIGVEAAPALPAAVSIELLHNFSLIHDDIQDQSETRRGQDTVWVRWGMPQAINVGDALFTIARNTLLDAELATHDAPRLFACIRMMDRACLDLCKGQFLDIRNERRSDISIDDYNYMARLKTGSLIGLSGSLGVFMATGDADQARRFQTIGENIGIAFQIQDDIFSVWSGEEITGKSSNDLLERKMTLPVVHAIAQKPTYADALRRMYLQDCISPADAQQIKEILDDAGSRAYCEDMVARHIHEAMSLLSEVGQNTLLAQLIERLLQRTC